MTSQRPIDPLNAARIGEGGFQVAATGQAARESTLADHVLYGQLITSTLGHLHDLAGVLATQTQAFTDVQPLVTLRELLTAATEESRAYTQAVVDATKP